MMTKMPLISALSIPSLNPIDSPAERVDQIRALLDSTSPPVRGHTRAAYWDTTMDHYVVATAENYHTFCGGETGEFCR